MNEILLETINKDLALYLQPIISSSRYQEGEIDISFYEVLSRVERNGKVFSPNTFLKGVSIDDYKHLACSVLNKLEPFLLSTSHSEIKFNINFHPEDFECNYVFDMIKKHKERIIVEIVEESSEIKEKLSILCDLKKEGVLLALDDFGSKFSLYNYLLDNMGEHNLFDIIKIDGTMVKSVAQNKKNGKSTFLKFIALMRELKQKTIAEYIESKELADIMVQHNIDYLQGYYFSKETKITDVFKSNQNLSKEKVS